MMCSFDPMAIVVDWLDDYRAKDVSIVDLFASDASLECKCEGQAKVIGRDALAEFWHRRFSEQPAGDLMKLETFGSSVVFTYAVLGGKVEVFLEFNEAGQITQCQLKPLDTLSALAV